ncbi:EnvZ/OmpR regulon moderator MzrA [Erwinia piriflorinigrans]|uniref:Modulator protein MzrA n=1 Tax=Erwinia piriflorinigrans CFBP 5888 TaxID=1161919 RepID=V5ZCC5_9GAMM|nr:EnvZ/OmpR regulon moderator MzrA [Erwinia piriflorinigrans]CCG88576.1 Protein-export membrane protein secD [Erwinia piriflorinigrans CFBP 5888]
MITAFMKKRAPQRRLTLWLALAAVALLGLAMMPALFRHESALQIRASRQGASLPDGFYVYQTLSAQGIHIKSITPEQNALVIRFESLEQSHAAERVLRELLPHGFDIAHHQNQGATGWINRISMRAQSIG